MRIDKLIKKRVMLHDGVETRFFNQRVELICPRCQKPIEPDLYQSQDFARLPEHSQAAVTARIKAITFHPEAFTRYSAPEGSLLCSAHSCEDGQGKTLVIFSYKEQQPARYIATLYALLVVSDDQ
ncbi:hypothetical protein [Kosakonia pseudosacchari]|uniref:Uncharacterized protein n=1 Tax=Kosakonia pseudosacchari TaxID=1646340 RepID=A0ABX4IXM9_9ENTR|nr:hypothetical protein [Kosakonia pseudosacchari]PDO90389.1 hypothetical protein BK796_02160 [Kosakonia pseudosacchari]